ncbi:MAG: sulfatase-like hydrolase/transferase, partial [Candidatus Aenigmarchaeota archaeon]|nr:sulfatase-like hydrolase/transferase [Candidatus Aenigmarchaeota archaeon]
MKRPNVIVIMLDGARADRMCNFKTLKNLSSRGILFSNMITYAPSTIASMYAIFSGTYGSESGVNNYWSSKDFRSDKYKTITEYLKNVGYYTRGDFINELAAPNQGFDELTIHNEYTDDLTQLHTNMVREMKNIYGGGKNFFLFLHYSYIHARTTKDVMDKYDGEYDERYYMNMKGNSEKFDEYTQEADEYLGNIIKAIKRQELFDDSIILILSDHGTGIGEKFGERRYGVYCYDYSIKTFLIALKKGIFPTKKIKNVVRTIDIMPTILEVLGIGKDPNLPGIRGISLMPLVRGEEKCKRMAFSETATFDEP